MLLEKDRLTYYAGTADQLLQQGVVPFDVVCSMEVIEHVADVPTFMASLSRLLRPGGLLFVSTLNRSMKSYAMAILGAEYVLRWLPPGTHDWHKFLTPSELTAHVRTNGLQMRDTNGMILNPLTCQWELSLTDTDVNYVICATKPEVL